MHNTAKKSTALVLVGESVKTVDSVMVNVYEIVFMHQVPLLTIHCLHAGNSSILSQLYLFFFQLQVSGM